MKIPHIVVLLYTLAFSNSAYPLPVVSAVIGDITQDQTITIQGSGFTVKTSPQPLFYWRADDSETGITPSVLGRKSDWDDTEFLGSASTEVVAPGSLQSVAFDHGTEETGAALSPLIIDSDRMYLHRKIYEDFDITQNIAIRTFVTTSSITGTINVGDTLTGASSGATGVVIRTFEDINTGRTTVFYSNTQGTIAADPPTDFVDGEIMNGPTATMTNAENTIGVFRTFNYKIMRFWTDDRQIDIFVSAQGADKLQYSIHPENTDSTIYGFDSDVIVNRGQMPFRWNTQEVEYSASSAPDLDDGGWNFTQNGVALSDTSDSIVTRTTENPELYNTLYQSQVSNGAQPDSVIYYDSLYIDDSLHRVIVCKFDTIDRCSDREVQIPTSWNDGEIVVNLNLGGLNPQSSLFLYVFDENGEANTEGFGLCPECPLPPATQ